MQRICHSPWPALGGGKKAPKLEPLFTSKGFNFFKGQRVVGKVVLVAETKIMIDLGLADKFKWVFNDVEGVFSCGDFVEACIKGFKGEKVSLDDVVELFNFDEFAKKDFSFWMNEFDDFKWFLKRGVIHNGVVDRLNNNGTALVDFGETRMGVLSSNVGLTVGQEIEVVVSAFMLSPRHGVKIRLERVE